MIFFLIPAYFGPMHRLKRRSRDRRRATGGPERLHARSVGFSIARSVRFSFAIDTAAGQNRGGPAAGVQKWMPGCVTICQDAPLSYFPPGADGGGALFA